MRILGRRWDSALAVDVGGLAVILMGERVSPARDIDEVLDRYGPWEELSGVTGVDRQEVAHALGGTSDGAVADR